MRQTLEHLVPRCARDECHNIQLTAKAATLRARSRGPQACHVIVGFHVVLRVDSLDLGFHVVIGV